MFQCWNLCMAARAFIYLVSYLYMKLYLKNATIYKAACVCRWSIWGQPQQQWAFIGWTLTELCSRQLEISITNRLVGLTLTKSLNFIKNSLLACSFGGNKKRTLNGFYVSANISMVPGSFSFLLGLFWCRQEGEREQWTKGW